MPSFGSVGSAGVPITPSKEGLESLEKWKKEDPKPAPVMAKANLNPQPACSRGGAVERPEQNPAILAATVLSDGDCKCPDRGPCRVVSVD